jgi:hypothetical protein
VPKKNEYERERYAALPNNKEEVRAKNREYQRSRRACLKVEADASKLFASSGIKDTIMDDKGNSYKRKRVMASQENNIGILLWFLLSIFCLCSSLSIVHTLFILAKIVLLIIFESFRSRHS